MARPLPDPVLFLDECLGTKEVAEALRSVGARVAALRDHFESGCPDEDWLPAVAGKIGMTPEGPMDWVVLTKDKWIRRRPAEMAALQEARAAAFVLSSKQLTGDEMGIAFAKAYPRIQRMLRKYHPPFVATVERSGSVRLLTRPERRAATRRSETRGPA